MIVATAGHVDHGKTTLVKALTGVETDRLEEEKRRGLSINLGYAYLPCDADVPLGFVDVPGHRRFINTMIAGISGIDLGMLVVAADDGIMPQTREHLDVLRLLGVEKLLLVITKIDRVEKTRLAEVTNTLHSYLDGLGLQASGTYPVDSLSRTGLEALRNDLLSAARDYTETAAQGCFRLAIDRAFTIKGAGLVVTGTAQSGRVSNGDHLLLFPGNHRVRVRSLRVHDTQAEEATGGQRCAVNISGDVALEQIPRGSWLLSPACGAPSSVIDVDVRLLNSAPFNLKHLAPVKVHIGAARIAGRLALVARSEDAKTLVAGGSAVAQLRLDEAVPVYRGQKFVLRDHAEDITMGGGQVLRPATAQRKFGKRQLDELAAMREAHVEDAAGALLALDGLLNLERFGELANLAAADIARLQGEFKPEQYMQFEHDGLHFVATKAHRQSIEEKLLTAIQQWHSEHPGDQGLKAARLRQLWQPTQEMPLVTVVLSALIQTQKLALREGNLALPDFRPARSSKLDTYWQQYHKILKARGTKIPLLSEINAQTSIAVEELRRAAELAVKEGHAYKVSDRRYALPATLLALCNAVIKMNAQGEEITVISVKKEWALGRNLAVEIVEFMDGIRFTARRGDARVILDEALPDRLFGQSAK